MLRGAVAGATAALGLPALEAMLNPHGTAHADGTALPCRFGVWFWGNGVRLDQWLPEQTGSGFSPSPSLQPLADAGLLTQISVVSGLAVPFGQEVVHDVGRAAMLSGSYDITQPTVGLGGNATLRSVDRFAADALAGDTLYRSLEVGVSQVGFGVVPDTSSVAWEDPVSPLPAEFSPHALFMRLFGDEVADSAEAAARVSMLDVVMEDAAALQTRLGAGDRTRLEAHLDGLRAIEQRLQMVAPTCPDAADPGDFPNDDVNAEPLVEISQAMSELLVVAMSCDLTRVFNFRFSPSAADTYFYPTGATETHHVMTHNPAYQDDVAEIVHFTMQQLAYLLQRCRQTEDGDATLLDRMAVYCLSEVAEGLTHATVDMPVLVAGRANGALRTGQHYRSPNQENTSRLPLTLLRALGIDIETFGAGVGKASDSLSALLT